MNKKFITRLISIGLISLSAVSLGIATFAWFAMPGGKTEKHIDGSIGLRSYFYSGDGSEEHPFEIVLPVHMYNLSRLQNYGIFPEKTYFQIGHIFDVEHGYQCMTETGERVDYLDMASFFSKDSSIFIRPIGSESTPFHGTFNGNGIPVKNLKISGYPEDIGVFGYVAYDGEIEGLVCSNLEVESLGYTSNTSDDTYTLFHEDIDDLFEGASYLTSDTNLDFYNYQNGEYVRAVSNPNIPGLKNINGVGGVSYSGIDLNCVPNTHYYNGYFMPTYPNVENDPFTYTWSSSSSLITETNILDIDGDGKSDSLIMFDLEKLSEEGEGKFNGNSDANMMLDTRLSLIASAVVDGIIYSRVIQSYLCEFHSNQSNFGDGLFDVSIYCNYSTPLDVSHPETNYRHGNNIGFLVGHLDGTLTNSYVYNGSFKFNDDNYNPINAETQTGLVGEVGANVINALNPDYNKMLHGETGVMNFSRIYSGIRRDFVPGDVTRTGIYSGIKYIFYDNYINTDSDSLFNDYSKYLRHTTGNQSGYFVKSNSGDSWSDNDNYQIPNPVREEYNTVDFIFNNIIQDEETVDRGLGVFKLTTARNTSANPDNYGDHVFDNLGSSMIVNGVPHSKVYFSTAEYDHTISNQPAWGTDVDDINPLRATTTPTDTNVFSFEYPFSRDHNYVYELDLTQNTSASSNNYMYNTNSPFLANYLKSKLIDKYGRPVPHGNYRCGFMFRNSENYVLNSLSSYMPMGYPGGKNGSLVDYGDGLRYPSNAIIFNIENENGANVSVVGNKNNISIYKFKTDGTSGPTKVYTMMSENTDLMDTHRYFSYDYRDGYGGDTSLNTIPYSDNLMGDGGALYGHIFKLDKLPEGWMYAIGSSKQSDEVADQANLYYLAVQGQTDGTIGTQTAQLGNKLEDVDFLLEEPSKNDYEVSVVEDLRTVSFNQNKVAKFNFTSDFNTTTGVFTINAVRTDDNYFINLHYNNNPQFITYLFAYDFKTEPEFYINESRYSTGSSATYTIIST